MIIRLDDHVLDINLEATKNYSASHSLCEFNEDRNFYAQAREKLPKLTAFLEDLGILIERPDEIGSFAMENMIDYHFVAYTVVGKVLEPGRYEIDLYDGGMYLNIVVNDWGVPNEQTTTDHFTLTVYNIRLPWVLDEPFPEEAVRKPSPSLLSKIRKFFKRS